MLFPKAHGMLLSAQKATDLGKTKLITALAHCGAHTKGRNSRVCECHWSVQELQSNLTESSWNSEGWKGPLQGCVATLLLSVSFQCQQMLSLDDVHNEKCKKKV